MTAARPRIPFQTEQYHSESSEGHCIWQFYTVSSLSGNFPRRFCRPGWASKLPSPLALGLTSVRGPGVAVLPTWRLRCRRWGSVRHPQLTSKPPAARSQIGINVHVAPGAEDVATRRANRVDTLARADRARVKIVRDAATGRSSWLAEGGHSQPTILRTLGGSGTGGGQVRPLRLRRRINC